MSDVLGLRAGRASARGLYGQIFCAVVIVTSIAGMLLSQEPG